MSTAIGHLAFNQTATKRTDYPLDVAINGDGFFKVQLPNGGAAYTRNGAFKLDGDGYLVTSNGYKLYGNVKIPTNVSADSVTIGADGSISYTQNGAAVSSRQSLTLCRFLYTSYLQSIGDDLFIANDMSGSEFKIDLTDEDEATSLSQGRLDPLTLTVRGTKQANELTNSVKQFVFGEPDTKAVFTQGVLANTGVATNVALSGEGFFKIALPNGDAAYTRDGSFVRDAYGNFVTADGYPLFDNVNVPRGAADSAITIDGSGQVTYTFDGATLNGGSIKAYRFINTAGLEPIYSVGENLFRASEDAGSAYQIDVGGTTTIAQKMVERNAVQFVKDYGSRVSIAASDGDDVIDNREAMITIDGGDGNDTITNTNMQSLIDVPVSTIVSTGGLTDIAIDGDGYFKVELPNGDPAYTRNGAFTRNSSGDLVTADGYPLYENVKIPDYISSDTLVINSSGAVTYYQPWDPQVEQSINVYVFANPDGLESIGNDLYKATEASGFSAQLDLSESNQRTAIVQGALETYVMRDEPTYLSIVDGGTGNDVIDNVLGDQVWIKGGQGSDTITNSGNLVTISGGTGNDVIYNFVGDATVDGVLKETGKPTSVAIEGDGYFKIKLSDGSATYTRNGDFHIDSAGNLVTSDGYALYDNVHIPLRVSRSTIDIARDGTVSYINHGSRVTAGQIKIYRSSDANAFIVQGAVEQSGVVNVDGQGTLTVIDGGDGDDRIINNSPGATIMGGSGSDRITLNGSDQLLVFSIGGGNDTIYGFDTDDTLQCVMADVNSSSLDGSNVILYIGGGSLTFVGASGTQLKVQDSTGKLTTSLYGRKSSTVGDDTLVGADTLAAGIVYNPKRPKTVTINSPYNGLVDAADFSYKVKTLDASNDDQPVILLAAQSRGANLLAGTGGSTLIGGNGDDKLYGNVGEDVFVYNVGGGKDLIGLKKSGQASLSCAAQDKIAIVGDESLSSDSLILTDRRNLLTVEFDSDKNSRLTINKTASLNAVQFYFGTDYVSALEGDPYTYGVTSDVSLNARGSVLGVKTTSSKTATIDASNMVSTAKTIDGSNARGKVHIIGNTQPNELIASNYGSTLDGGWNKAKNKGTNDKYYGGSGADVYIYDGASNDVIYNYEAQDKIVMSSDAGSVTGGRLNGRNVTFKVGKNSLTVREAKDKTITLTDGDGQTSQYQFTSKNRTLDKALLSTSDQFSTEDYWFNVDAEEDQLAAILNEAPPLDAVADFSSKVDPNNLLDGITGSARSRHRSQK